MYGKTETLQLLDREGISYELYEHAAVFTAAQAIAAHIPHGEFGAKNLFLRDDKHRAYYLVVLPDQNAFPSAKSKSAWVHGASRLRATETWPRCSASSPDRSRRSARSTMSNTA